MATKVKLRRKPITQGRESLYLDYYPPIRDPETMKMIHKEYLGIYIFQEPQNQIQKEYNEDMLLKGEAIQARRFRRCGFRLSSMKSMVFWTSGSRKAISLFISEAS